MPIRNMTAATLNITSYSGPNASFTETWNFAPDRIMAETSLSRVYAADIRHAISFGIVGYRRRLPSGADEYVHISDNYRYWANAVFDNRLSSVTWGWNLEGAVAIRGLINLFYL